MNKNKRIKILNRFERYIPHPKIELHYQSNFELLIAVLLSSRTTDVSVNKVTRKLFSVANTPKSMIHLGIDKLKNFIKPIGFFNRKSKNIIETCNILLEKFNNLIPNNKEDLESMPGIGSKTANVILNVGFLKPTIAVDTHVFRVCNRTHFLYEKNVKKMEKKLSYIVPNKFKINFHRWFVLHGKKICTSRNPMCKSCFITDLCEFDKKNYRYSKKNL